MRCVVSSTIIIIVIYNGSYSNCIIYSINEEHYSQRYLYRYKFAFTEDDQCVPILVRTHVFSLIYIQIWPCKKVSFTLRDWHISFISDWKKFSINFNSMEITVDKNLVFRCNVSFECACDPGWKGLFCNEPACASDCNPSQGYCDRPGECKWDFQRY